MAQLTYGNIKYWLYEWNDKYNFRLPIFFTNSDRANVSTSENGAAPANKLLHGSVDAPASEINS